MQNLKVLIYRNKLQSEDLNRTKWQPRQILFKSIHQNQVSNKIF